MRLGSFRLTSQRAARAVAGLVAMFLLTGNVLAAAGLCAVRAPAGTGLAVELAGGRLRRRRHRVVVVSGLCPGGRGEERHGGHE